MKITKTKLEGLLIVEPTIYQDSRGFFTEKFNKNKFIELGLPGDFVQDNFSRSKSNVIRGLHYQYDKPQGKLVSCVRGRIIDVAVDVRLNSKTFGEFYSIELSEDNCKSLWVPAGFAHGFCVPSNVESADVLYKVNQFYNAAGENGIIWNDEKIGIDWKSYGITKEIISEKDMNLPSFDLSIPNFKNFNPNNT